MVDLQMSLPTGSVRVARQPRRVRVPRPVAFVALSVSLLAFFVAAGAPTPLLPLYETEWRFAPALLTIAFGVYAFGLIAALLVVGGLSDFIGRRPVVLAALVLELVAMTVFLFSSSIGWIITARVLQGIATGVASSTFVATIVELASERRKKLGTLMTGLMTTGGLGIGALFSGLIALAVPADAAIIVWVSLVVIMAAGTVFAVLMPETSSRRRGAVASLVPRFAVPAQVRALFARTVPVVIATFLTTALFLGLIPTILHGAFGVTLPIVGGLVNFVMFGTATLASGVSGRFRPQRLRVFGGIAMLAGAVLIVASLATRELALVWIAAVVSGAGMGSAFSGSLRGLVAETAPHERAGMLAALFTVAYLTFGAPAIAAGLLAGATGIVPVAVGFGVATVIVAIGGIVSSSGIGIRGAKAHNGEGELRAN